MKVNTQHAAFAANKARWKRCTDVYAGGDVVKAGKEAYLPRLSGQTQAEYDAYVMRAEFFGAFSRTVDGFAGVVLRKPAETDATDILVDVMKDVTMNGVTFQGLAQSSVTAVLREGRGGVLVDWSNSNNRAYAVWYDADQIVNWRSVIQDGNERLSLVVLKEAIEEPDAEDPFVTHVRTQYRSLHLVGGGVEVTLWRQKLDAKGKPIEDDWEPVPATDGQPNPIVLRRREKPLEEIPFVFFGPEDMTSMVQKPPLLDLADANLSHFRTSADLEHGAHFTGLPTPVITGHTYDAGRTYTIGSGKAWVLEEAEAKVTMLEFTGQGLQALFDLAKAKEERMAIQGGRLLEPQKRAVEASDTHRMRQSGDESVLKRLAMSVSASLASVLGWMAWWAGADDRTVASIAVRLNTAFETVSASPEEIKAWILSMQAGRMSGATFWYLLTRAELTPPGVSWEAEQQRIATEEGEGADEPADIEPAVA